MLFQQLTEAKAVTIPHLQHTLRFFRLPVSGEKATLIKRLVDHLLGAHNRTYQTSFLIFLHTFARGDPDVIQRFEQTTISGKAYPTRVLSMRFVALRLLYNTFQKGLFCDDLPSEVNIKVLLYDDATSELSWPLYASFLGFVADLNVFKETSLDSEILRLLPWFIGLVPETKDTCKQIDQIKSVELKELLQQPFYINNHKITLQL